ncbi:MAG TPA: hypothetical protein DCM87_00825 [Planctomycetes bacterium]|nr:hypothetical protein [Planctomycetota bacterium]
MLHVFNRNGALLFMVALAVCASAGLSSAQDAALEDLAAIEAAKTSIAWDSGPIKVTIGNGLGVVEDAAIAFTASAAIQNVTVVATSTVAGFVDISPAYFDAVPAGVPCSLTVRFRVPAGAVAGRYKGSIQVMSGGLKYNRTLGVTITVDYAGAAVAAATRVITQSTWDALQYAAPDYSLIEFLAIPAELVFVQPGDVLASGVTAQTPFGLVRKVVSVGSDPDTPLSLICSGATLADVFTSATLAITKVLSPEDVADGQDPVGGSGPYDFFVPYADVLHDADDDPGTTDDRVTLAGTIKFDSRFSFAFGIAASVVQSASFTSETGREIEMTLDAQSGIAPFAKETDLWSRQMKPLTVWVGWVPVVITPVLTVRADVAGDVAAPSQASVTESATMTAGAEYAGGVWQPVASFSVASLAGAASPAPGCNVKARVGPGIDLLVYDVLAPSAQPDGYLRTQTGAVPEPWWQLHGGIEADIGVATGVLDNAVSGAMFPAAVQYEALVAEGGGTTPAEDGFVSGIVRDAATGAPLAGVHAVATIEGSPAAGGYTIADGTFTLTVPAADGYTVVFSKTGYLSATYLDISVAGALTTYLEPILQIDEPDDPEDTGAIGGTIVNALTGLGVSGLTVQLREGFNNTTGTVVATAPLPTDAAGHYSITELAPGNYTARTYGDDYHDAYFSVICVANLTIDNQDATITPILSPGETRIVLTWGEVPADLDAHLTGPVPDGSRFWIYYYYLYHPNPWAAYVLLDHDDTTSYGPETITILEQIDGVYRFCVHDFTNGGSTTSTALSNSGALVRVYRDTGLAAMFAVPPNRAGTLWAVFDMSGDTITPLNIMTFDPTVIHP